MIIFYLKTKITNLIHFIQFYSFELDLAIYQN